MEYPNLRVPPQCKACDFRIQRREVRQAEPLSRACKGTRLFRADDPHRAEALKVPERSRVRNTLYLRETPFSLGY